MSGKRALILTSTKGLMQQYADTFTQLLVDIRGKGNYTCKATQTGGQFAFQYFYPVSVDDAPCQYGEICNLKSTFGCTYYDQLALAKESPIVLGNYSLQTSIRQFGDKTALGTFDLIVCDEAHELVEALTQALSVEISEEELDALSNCSFPSNPDPVEWAAWARYWVHHINDELDVLKQRTDKFSRRRAVTLNRINKKLSQVSMANAGWLVTIAGRVRRIQPVWPQDDAERLVFAGASRVLLTSATIRPKTLDILNIPSSAADYFAYPSDFPLERRPVYYLPTVRMHYKNTDAEVSQWINRVDQIIAGRQDRKGIIHTVSFARQQQLMTRSKYRHLMIGNPPGSSQLTEETVKKFKSSPPGTILVSPSVDTGFDFPYTEAEYCVIVKVPYADTNAPLYKARILRDPDYGYYVTAQTVVQMAGRPMRAADDQCEVFITDEGFKPFLGQHRSLLSSWFLPAVKKVSAIPSPPTRLSSKC
jgi:ATP-dependent DNA helicase DinG